ncbi:oleosin Cor a 15 [Humulus lupulus]|uniref:oleosin Cor a 15 n=1 Tax=Humulus lupulus TaxID=3486 RepID=UPI002B41182F|nr:oleosin Cor a 15 [Humulus lupulus]
MADYYQPRELSSAFYGDGSSSGKQQHQIPLTTMVLTSLASLVFGGPLLAMAGFSFMASVAIFLVSSPLLVLIFSPLLLGAGAVLVAAMAGFGAAAVIGLGALSTVRWIYKGTRGRDTAERVGEHGKQMMIGLENL